MSPLPPIVGDCASLNPVRVCAYQVGIPFELHPSPQACESIAPFDTFLNLNMVKIQI
jgi:hypothetical protein